MQGLTLPYINSLSCVGLALVLPLILSDHEMEALTRKLGERDVCYSKLRVLTVSCANRS